MKEIDNKVVVYGQMKTIEVDNTSGLCAHKYCGNEHTHVIEIEINQLPCYVCFCDEHAQNIETIGHNEKFGLNKVNLYDDCNEINHKVYVAKTVGIDKVHVKVKCPFCGNIHTHGSGGKKNNFGARYSHCSVYGMTGKEYEIITDTIEEVNE